MKKTLFVFLLCLLAIPTLPAQTLLQENFNSGIPGSWTVVNGGSSGHTWVGTTGGFQGQTLDGSEFAFVNSDGAGGLPPVLLRETLLSPVVNGSAFGNVVLEYDHFFRGLGQTDSGHVEVYNGTAWQRVASYGNNTGAFSNPHHATHNITALANANLQVRFVYDDDSLWAWYWAVDNVHIFAPLPDDAGVQTALAPLLNGRALTSNALSASTPVSVQVRNYGSTTLSGIPLYYSINGGAVQGPETLAGPLNPSQSQAFTFAATADLSAVGTYRIEVWTGLPSDINAPNDTLRFKVEQLANPPLLFPHCQNLEGAKDTTVQSQWIGLPGVPELDFTTSEPAAGRMRTFAGPGFAQSGFRALTLDRNPTGVPNAVNHVTFTYNLSGLNAAQDQVLLDLGLMDHGDEVQPGDSIWIRGCDACGWLRVADWHTLSGGIDGVYFGLNGYDVSARLVTGGQNFSTSFQIRVGQEDNFNTVNTTGNDGLSVDDLCLRRVLETNAAIAAIALPVEGQCGDSTQALYVVVVNNGRDTLHNIPVQALVSGAGSASLSATLPGPLLPNDQDTLFLGTFNTYLGGGFQFMVSHALAGDEYAGDDTLVTTIHLLGLPAAPFVQGDTVCTGGSAQLFVTNPQGGVKWYWFDAPVGGNLLHEGLNFSTPPITGTQSYYVEARHIRSSRLGPADNSIGSGGPYAVFTDGLAFDAYREFILDSLTFYPADTGLVVFELVDSGGNVIGTRSWNVEPVQAFEKTRVGVGMLVPAGVNHRMRATGTTLPSLWRNNTGAAYPYTAQGAASITGALNALPDFYYFWYDLRLSYPDCPGPRAVVQVDTTSVPAQALFAANPTYLDVDFVNQSSNGFQYFWDFGDGNTSMAAAPQHSYAVGDTYQVCLIAYSPCGNDTLCQQVIVTCAPLNPGFFSSRNLLMGYFTDTTSNSTGSFWDFGDGTTGNGPTVNHLFPTDSIYWVCLSSVNACGDTAQYCDSLAFCGPLSCNFNWVAQPSPAFTYEFQPIIIGQATSVHWDFGDGFTSNVLMPTHTFPNAGNFVVTLTVTNVCGNAMSNPNLVSIPVGVESGMGQAWGISPNPTSGAFVLNAVGAHGFELWDQMGRKMGVPAVEEASGIWRLDLEGLSVGVYTLMVLGDEGTRSFKVLKR